ncbi:MAG: hydrogenase iron-sulfur subunit [Methanomassiliicoccales archaeon]|jgi:F420-non-reducing hydrogenase iron-sulfur subunit
MSWKPRIVAFCCNWCAYAGADLAGISRRQYSPDIRILRVMCSGRVDPALILKCYEKGADGVMVLGCHMGDCHYLAGNEEAQKRIDSTKELLELLGIDDRRLLLDWVSASEGERFARIANEFVAVISELGPLRRDSRDG